MRKLKLQMQISIDGFVAAIDHSATNFNWDDESKNYSVSNLEDVDTVLIGRKIAVDFISYWAAEATKPSDPEYLFGKTVTAIPKIIFSKTLSPSQANGGKIASGDLVEEVNQLKRQDGKAMLVYGGAGFVSSLIKHRLIDEYHLLVNPVALGNGIPIFNALENSLSLKLLSARQFSSGTVALCYQQN